jgi:UPF0716 family protein affecting phage T7 exclusion
MNMLKMCLTWRVLGGLAAVGAGVYLFAPGLFAATLPLLVLAICPLSMVLMMAAMRGGQDGSGKATTAAARAETEDLEAQSRRLEGEQRAVAEQLSARSRDERAHLS